MLKGKPKNSLRSWLRRTCCCMSMNARRLQLCKKNGKGKRRLRLTTRSGIYETRRQTRSKKSWLENSKTRLRIFTWKFRGSRSPKKPLSPIRSSVTHFFTFRLPSLRPIWTPLLTSWIKTRNHPGSTTPCNQATGSPAEIVSTPASQKGWTVPDWNQTRYCTDASKQRCNPYLKKRWKNPSRWLWCSHSQSRARSPTKTSTNKKKTNASPASKSYRHFNLTS